MRKLTPLFVVLALGACKADGDDSSDSGTDTGTEDGSDDGGSGDGGGGLSCVPGQSIACACPNGDTGAQICNDDGASYGPCECTGGGGGGTGDDGGTGTGGDGGTGGGLPDGAPCETNDQCESGYCWSDWNQQQQQPEPAECKPECIPNADQSAYCDEDADCCAGTCQMYGQAEGMCQGG